MKLIVGLGNPGQPYQNTRHNLGFVVADRLAQSLSCPPFGQDLKLKSQIIGARVTLPGGEVEPVLLIKPQTYMNKSGEAVQLALNYYKDRLTLEDVWVVHDDVDLDLGRIKIQRGGGTAGHHGLESIVKAIGYGFPRFRFGIGRPGRGTYDVENYVLQPFKPEEFSVVEKSIVKVVEAIQVAAGEGLDAAMDRFNGPE